ncbi:DUF7281 domain-containing protein [Celerinatantimonas diazotrophica]|uniref:Uncharacterized protein DUF2220 n=1 Tax=Celerinatantimonas diazotrophica TaxID=412034 RepID=A0A4V2PNB0_9GAMM|nr:Wadjet anti-phage system protein JetD domain-containing protein [Celerinatantimonas diazotrophica]TCK46418.1 uncharacterized protein DUF2220 [Celerinatantimonas diazotrophica]CAG9295205.1 hypothetical protein CEDIAZO_00317 [Celerinatantimonas diazotrophica]
MINDKPLTPRERRWLRHRDEQLKFKSSVKDRVTKDGMIHRVLQWCSAHELIADNSSNLPSFSWTKALLDQIELTQQQLGETSFRTSLASKTRMENVSDQEDKSVGIQPREYRVLVRLPQPIMHCHLGAQFVDMDFHDIDLLSYQQLLVVENLDCFYVLEQFSMELNLEQMLVIYRGDFAYGKGAAALKEQWLKTGKPLCYFGDFDLKGVSIALNEGYSTMLLPEFEQLNKVVSTAQLPTKQLKFDKGIRQNLASLSFSPYQQLILTHKGLRQQKMTEMPLLQVAL